MPVPPSSSAAHSVVALPPPRAFGRSTADLAHDFAAGDRCALASRVVAGCCEDHTPIQEREHAAWALPIGTRIARLLRVVALTTEEETLPVVLSCPQPRCRSRFEVMLPLTEILEESGGAAGLEGSLCFTGRRGEELRFRLPTGRDQVAWRGRTYQTRDEAALHIARCLLVPSDRDPGALGAHSPAPRGSTEASTSEGVEPPLHPDDVSRISSLLQAADPLVGFSVRTSCPHCDHEAEIAVDLEHAALQRLADERRSLLRSVHLLASHYGWTEAEILAIPPRRRAEYLRIIDAEHESLP